MRPVVLCKLNASRSFLPELEMPVYASSDQKILVLGYSYLRNCVPVHKALLIHLRTWQSSQVCLLMLEYLHTGVQSSRCSLQRA